MKHSVRSLLLLIFSTTIVLASAGYIDNDLDGVDDTIDLCPNTPFDVLVDAHGCDMNKKGLHGKLLLQAGATRNIDTVYEDTTLFNLFADYSVGNWDISLSTTNYNTGNLTGIVDVEDDLFVTAGYTFHKEKLTGKLMLGTKFAFTKESANDRNNDWYAALNLDYALSDNSNLFGYYSYTLSSDSAVVDYKNFHTLSIGSGYNLTPQWYSALSLNYASAYYQGGEAYRSISWYNLYMLTDRLYLSLNYAYGLNDEAYDHTLSFNIGATFE